MQGPWKIPYVVTWHSHIDLALDPRLGAEVGQPQVKLEVWLEVGVEVENESEFN